MDGVRIDYFRRQFLQQRPARHFDFAGSRDEEWQDAVAAVCVHGPKAYTTRVIKALMASLGPEEAVSVDLLTLYTDLMAQAVVDDESSVVVYTASDFSVRILESKYLTAGGSTGLRTWNAAMCLAEHLIANPHLLHGKRVVELGSGTGLVAIVCARLGGNILATDKDARAIDGILHNAKQNSVHVSTEWFAWGESIQADLLVAADVIYDPVAIPLLLQTIALANCDAIITAETRSESTFLTFQEELLHQHLSLETLPPEPKLFFYDAPVKKFHIHRI